MLTPEELASCMDGLMSINIRLWATLEAQVNKLNALLSHRNTCLATLIIMNCNKPIFFDRLAKSKLDPKTDKLEWGTNSQGEEKVWLKNRGPAGVAAQNLRVLPRNGNGKG